MSQIVASRAVYMAREATQRGWRSRSRPLWVFSTLAVPMNFVATTTFYHNIVVTATTVYSPEKPGQYSPLVTTTKLPIISVIGNRLGRKIGWEIGRCQPGWRDDSGQKHCWPSVANSDRCRYRNAGEGISFYCENIVWTTQHLYHYPLTCA